MDMLIGGSPVAWVLITCTHKKSVCATLDIEDMLPSLLHAVSKSVKATVQKEHTSENLDLFYS